MQTVQNHEQKRVLKVFTIVEKPGSDKGIWLEVGVASANRDGSLRVKLDAFPANGSLHIREYEPRKKDGMNNQNNPFPQANSWR